MRAFLISGLLVVGPILPAFAHGGGLNADGCHNNRRTGDTIAIGVARLALRSPPTRRAAGRPTSRTVRPRARQERRRCGKAMRAMPGISIAMATALAANKARGDQSGRDVPLSASLVWLRMPPIGGLRPGLSPTRGLMSQRQVHHQLPEQAQGRHRPNDRRHRP